MENNSKEEKETKEPKETEVRFNLGSDILKLIAGLLNKASECCLEGDPAAWFTTLKRVKALAIARFNQEERKRLHKFEDIICVAHNNYNERETQEKYNTIIYWTERYENYLTELLDAKGYLIPLKMDTTSLFGQEDLD